MRRIRSIVLAGAFAIALFNSTAVVASVTEAVCRREQLPQSVVRMLALQAGDRQPKQITEIRYDGLPILYEAELEIDGRESTITIRPGGALAQDDVRDSVEVRSDDAGSRPIDRRKLPAVVADAANHAIGEKDITAIHEIRYEGLVVLYRFSVPGGADDDDDNDADGHANEENGDGRAQELYIYPSGATAARAGEMTEREVTLDDLPADIAAVMQGWLGRAEADEMEEIRYEGIPVMYEAEIETDGTEREIIILADGTTIEQDDDDEHADDGLVERSIDPGELPRPIAQALSKLLGGDMIEADEIYYEGVLVLYEAENDKFEASVYPNGDAAGRSWDSDDDDDEDDEDD